MPLLPVVEQEASRKTHLQLSALFQYVAKDFMKTACGPFCFNLDFALLPSIQTKIARIVKKYATARNNRSRLIKVMPL